MMRDSSTIELRSLDGCGVEVLGLDLARPLSSARVASLVDAFDAHHLLLVRDQQLSPTRQVEIAQLFGPVKLANGEPVGFVSNVRPDGVVPNGPLLFHSDMAFLETPMQALSLFGLDIPPSGGETLFASAVAAVNRLDADLRRRLSSMHVCNASAFRVDFAERQREHEVDPAEVRTTYPVIAEHSRTGVPVLMINESHSIRILELSVEESDAALDAVYDALYDPSNVYEHRWRPGDFIIWDNIAIQHGRRTFDSAEPRTLQRVVLGDEDGFVMTPELIGLYRWATARR